MILLWLHMNRNHYQTGPKIRAGGFQAGFFKVGYQVDTAELVVIPPIAATTKGATRAIIKATMFDFCVFIEAGRPEMSGTRRAVFSCNHSRLSIFLTLL